MSPLLNLQDLASLCQSPWGLDEYSPLAEHNYLLLDIRSAIDAVPGKLIAKIAARLRLLPCPVIAVGESAAPELLRGIDVVIAKEHEAELLIRNINAQPLTAMTLAQLLRHNEDVTAEQGLFAESLAYASLQGGVEFAGALKSRPGTVSIAQENDPPVLVDRAGGELHIRLNRPLARNAYSAAMRDSLYEALQLLKMDSSLQRAVVSGEGACFCIGGDLHEFGTVSDTSTAHAVRSSRSVGHALLQLSGQLEFHLHSACIGAGIELPAFAARVVASKSAFMQLPEIKLGLLPGAGGTVSILRRIGRQRTAYMALSARRINATTALQWGLIDAII
jgi:Enoyl-CoA hydratase/isomerase